MNLREVNRILQYPRYLYHIEEIFGPRGSSIIEFLLLRGQLQAAEIIDLQMEKEKCANEDERRKVLDENKVILKNLISNRFIHKEAILKSVENAEIPVLESAADCAFTINFERGQTDNKPEYWSVNHTRFSHYIKDQLLVERASLSLGCESVTVQSAQYNDYNMRQDNCGCIFLFECKLVLSICGCMWQSYKRHRFSNKLFF